MADKCGAAKQRRLERLLCCSVPVALSLSSYVEEIMKKPVVASLCLLVLLGCAEGRTEAKPDGDKRTNASVSVDARQGGGKPYEILGSEVWNVNDPDSGRHYQVFVALPKSYAGNPSKRYPVVYVTDADYGFPIIRNISRRLNIGGSELQEFILIGLSYAVGEESMASRRRDYTPTTQGAHDAPADAVHGESLAYVNYIRNTVFPFVANKYRTDESKRLYVGHSYGGLLGAQILFTTPELFSGYILGSPSLWYDGNVMGDYEKAYANKQRDLRATVYIYVGEYEDMKPEDRRYAKRHNMVTDAKRLERSLRSRNYSSLRVRLDVLSDEDHLSVAPRGFTHGLKFLLSTVPEN